MARSRKGRSGSARLSNKHLSQIALFCDNLGPDDGVDPRDIPNGPRSNAFDRKTAQLCAAVKRVVDQLLAGESNDPVLSDLHVVDVLPAPNASRLRVVVELSSGSSDEQPNIPNILDRLDRASGWMRSEIAASIRRRKTPDLTFAFGNNSRAESPNTNGGDR